MLGVDDRSDPCTRTRNGALIFRGTWPTILFCNSYSIWIADISRFTSAGKLFISDRNPSVLVDMVASNTTRKR